MLRIHFSERIHLHQLPVSTCASISRDGKAADTMAAITASWAEVATSEQLQRSSHNVCAIGSSLFVFGGELKPREPRDNDLHKVELKGYSVAGQSAKVVVENSPV